MLIKQDKTIRGMAIRDVVTLPRIFIKPRMRTEAVDVELQQNET